MKMKVKIMLLMVLLLGGCSDPNLESGPNTIDEVLTQGGEFEEVPETRTIDTLAVVESNTEDIEEPDGDGNVATNRYVCTSRTLSVEDGNAQFPLFNPNAEVVFPGNLLQGKSLSNATPNPILVKRAGGRVSYDLNNGNLKSSFEVDEVNKDQIQDAMNNIIDGAVKAGNIVPANFQLDIKEVQSEQQLALELGLKVQTFATKAKANLSFNTNKQYHSFLVKLTQSYYTMSFSLPTSLDDLFHPSVTPQQLSTFVGADNPATFVSSVTYGRIFYMLIESTSTSREMEAKLSLSYGAFKNKVSGSVDVNAFNSLKNTTIKVIAYGGDAKGAFQLAGETNIADIANKLAEGTDVRTGLPLSYVVRSVQRPDQIVGTRLATEYDFVECDLKGVLPPEGYKSLVDLYKTDEDGGGIGAMIRIADSNLIVYNKLGTKYAWYNGNSGDVLGVFDIHDPDGPMGVTTFESVGAALQFSDGNIYIFNGTGLKCEIFKYPMANYTGNTLPTSSIGKYHQSAGANIVYLVNELFGDSGNFQFANRGFEAATKIGATKMIYFAKPGDEFAVYNSAGEGSWESPKKNSEFIPETKGGSLFEKVGAASVITFGGSSGRWLFVNAAGDQLLEMYSSPERIYKGPWVIN